MKKIEIEREYAVGEMVEKLKVTYQFDDDFDYNTLALLPDLMAVVSEKEEQSAR